MDSSAWWQPSRTFGPRRLGGNQGLPWSLVTVLPLHAVLVCSLG
jgi:hypothetical protein